MVMLLVLLLGLNHVPPVPRGLTEPAHAFAPRAGEGERRVAADRPLAASPLAAGRWRTGGRKYVCGRRRRRGRGTARRRQGARGCEQQQRRRGGGDPRGGC